MKYLIVCIILFSPGIMFGQNELRWQGDSLKILWEYKKISEAEYDFQGRKTFNQCVIWVYERDLFNDSLRIYHAAGKIDDATFHKYYTAIDSIENRESREMAAYCEQKSKQLREKLNKEKSSNDQHKTKKK